MVDLRTLAPGTRVVVRYRLDDGRATDALGPLVSVDAALCVVDTKRGPDSIPLERVILAKVVPPPARRKVRPAE